MKYEASLQPFFRKLKQKNLFNETEYDKLYSSDSAPARIYGTLKIHKFSSSDSFPKLRPIVSCIGSFNYNLARFLCDLLIHNINSIKRLSILQEKSLRLMYFLNRNAHTTHPFKDSGMLKFSDTIALENCIFIKNYFNQTLPTPFKN